jgi:hypothetical protein
LIIGVADAVGSDSGDGPPIAIPLAWCSGAPADAWPDAGVWPSAANPPATAAPLFRRSLRLVRFELISLSFEKGQDDEITLPLAKV